MIQLIALQKINIVGKVINMTPKMASMSTQDIVQQKAKTSPLVAIAFAALLGFGMITIAGHLQAHTLHDAAHDTRHATGFPCH
jgi:cobalt transporter subunit CbtB